MKSRHIENYIYSNRPIGKGSFSKVYKGFDTKNDEIVAIKIIDKIGLRETIVDKIHSEILLMANIKHANIINIKNFIQDDDHFYIIMEYCSGGDLSELLRKGKLTEKIAQEYMKQLASALSLLKSKNIVHRDLKPSNIILTGDQKTIKLIDFNFARELRDHELTNTLCGTPMYMSPEMIEKKDYSIKSDLWSVGVILYEMVYGQTPYHSAQNIIDLIDKIKNTPIKYTTRVSKDINMLIQRLLVVNVKNRMSWDEFFNYYWLVESESEKIIATTSAEPINIQCPRIKVEIQDNYIPLGVNSLPNYMKNSVISNNSNSTKWGSAPDETKKIVNGLINYMSSSLKGAFDYIGSH